MNPDKRNKSAIVAIAVSIAIPAEGLRHYAYYDPPGVLTVCYGSTNNVVKNRYYTMDECKARLSSEMLEAVETVERCRPGLPDGVAASFADAVFNSGPKIVCNTKSSTAARMLAAGDLDGACRQHPRWNKANVAGVFVALPGLTKRTKLRESICLAGISESEL